MAIEGNGAATDPNAVGAAQGGSGQNGAQGAYTPPATQEEFDKRISDRLRRHDARAEANLKEKYADVFAKAEELDALREKDKTELEKANERADAAEAERDALKAAAERSRWAQAAADATGLPVSLMHGDSEEEYLANAKAMQEYMGKQPKYPQTPNGGTPASTACSSARSAPASS